MPARVDTKLVAEARKLCLSNRAGMKKEHVSENSIMIYDDVMYPDNVTYEHIGEISIS